MIEKKDTARTILKAAASEFSNHGLAGARIDRIAAHAGVNKAMIYYHFKSKDNLYQTIIDSHLDKIRNFFKERMALLESPEEIFRSLAEFYNTQFIDREFIPIFLREIADGSDRIRNAFGDFIAKGPAVKLRALLKNAIETGEFRAVSVEQTIASFIGMNLYYLLMSPLINKILELKDENDFREKRPEAVFDLFLNGIKAR